jgi:ribosomal protein L5
MIKFTEYPLNPIHENIKYNLSLYQITKFPYQHLHCVSSLSRRILSFRFRSIEFNKKRSLLFFLFLELVTGQKPIAITSSANIQK